MRRNLNEIDAQLSLEDFKRVLNSGNFQHVCLHGWGEPLLNPQIFQMVKYAESQGISTELTTNGTLIKENVEKIFSSGLKNIAFGIHDKKILPFILPQIKELIRKRNKERARKPRIYMDIVIYEENLGQILDLIKIASQLNIDAVVLHRLFNVYPVRKPRPLDGNVSKQFVAMAGFKTLLELSNGVYNVDPSVEYISAEEEKELFGKAKELAKELKIKLYLPPRPSIPCVAVRYSIFATVEGKVTPCPYLAEFYLGDALNHDDVKDIYLKKINFIKNMSKHPICNKCPLGSRNGNFYC